MKKTIAFAIALVLISAMLVSCSSQNESTTSELSNTTDSASTLESRTFKIAHESSSQGPLQVYAETLNEHLKELSDGAYDLQIFSVGQLGDSIACVEQCQAGTLDMVIGGFGNFSTMTGGLTGVLGLPYVLPSNMDDVVTMMNNSEAATMMADAVAEKGITILAWPCEGSEWWSANFPIYTPADMSGRAFRVYMSPIALATFEAYGANATPLAFTDVYSSLQLGVVEGQCNCLTSIKDMKFYEVQDYLIDNGATYLIHLFGMNNEIWSSLPAEGQAIIQEAVALTETEYYEYLYAGEEELAEFFEDEGLTIIYLSDEEKAAFKELVVDVPDVFVNDFEDTELARKVVDQFIADCNAYS